MQFHRTEPEPFRYLRLNTTTPTIRLLQLSRTWKRKIIGQLKHYPLKNARFNAISYVWGQKSNLTIVKINNRPIHVLENLYRILEVICDDATLARSLWWIDYICIDQGSGFEVEKERNSQVSMMKQIYESAEMVLGWLGPSSEETKGGIEFLHVLKKNRNRLHAQKYSRDKVLGGELEDRKKWEAIANIFLKPWWDRVWTLQEYIVPTKFMFYCGTENIDREHMKAAIYGISLTRSIDPSLMAEHVYNMAWNRRRLLLWYQKRLPMQLLGLLAYAAGHKFTNPRDRIYSVLGMINDVDLVGQPRYGDDVSKVYTDLVMSFVRKYKSLDVICLADRFNQDVLEGVQMPTLPSWCPDWRVQDLPWVIPAMACQSSGNIGNLRPIATASREGEATYAAGISSLPLEVMLSEDRATLSCQAIFLSYIDGIGGLRVARRRNDDITDREEVYMCVQSDTEGKQVMPAKETDEQHFEPCSLTPQTANAILWDVAKSLMLDRQDRYLDQKLSGGCLNFRKMCMAAIQAPESVDSYFLDWFQRNRNLNIQGYSLKYICTHSEQELKEKSGFASQGEFLSRFKDTTRWMSKRLMTTADGNVGMVPYRASKGDEIWVLLGCSIPMVLRRREGDMLQVVGECYLNHFMNGEAFDLLKRGGKTKIENIKLA